MRWALVLALSLPGSLLWAEGPDWDQFFRGVWDRGSLGKEVAWALNGASARLRAEEAQWFPVLSVGSDASRPQQLSARSLGGLETFSLAATGSLIQRVPGGGSVKASARVEPIWTGWHPDTEPEWAPVFSFEGILPLVAPPSLALIRTIYEQEVLDQALISRRGWLNLVQAASEVDLARLTWEARRAREAVAAQKMATTAQLRLQGRSSEALAVADRGALVRARWESLQAETALVLAQGEWERLGGAPLPPVDEAILTWAARDHGVGLDDLEVERQKVRTRLEDLRIRERGADLGPTLGWGLSVSRPAGHSAVLELQLGVSMTTDALLVGPAVEGVRRSWNAQGDLVVERVRRSALLRAEARELHLSALRGARVDIEQSLRSAQVVLDALDQAAARGEVLRAEVLEAEAVAAEMALLARRLVWEEVMEVGFR